MITSVHIADVGATTAITLRAPKPHTFPGLRRADVGLAAPLSPRLMPSVQFGRVVMVGCWDDDAALDRFLDEHPVAATLDGGFRVRLEPIRVFGDWKGQFEGVPTERATPMDGPAAVLTIGRLRMTQAYRFFKASARAEGAVLEADGLIFATGFARPPLVATFSLWASSRASSTYAYGRSEPAHADAVEEGEQKAFHHEQAFVRFRPYAAVGHLSGTNPLTASALTAAEPQAG